MLSSIAAAHKKEEGARHPVHARRSVYGRVIFERMPPETQPQGVFLGGGTGASVGRKFSLPALFYL